MTHTSRSGDKRSADKGQAAAANHPDWDRRQGTPKDQKATQTVERSSSRYSASEQSEEKRKGGRPG